MTVLPDVGPKSAQTWPEAETERLGGPARVCKRCAAGNAHGTFDCPA